MGDNTFGTKFKITSFGESHGKVVGVVIDGTPAGLKFDLNYIQSELDKRKPGQSKFTSTRKEQDKVEVLSGIFNNTTTGAPICLIIRNQDVDSSNYEKSKGLLRPSHVDYVALQKYGDYADFRGSGRFSGRITAGYVMAGAVAKQILNIFNISILAYTKSIGSIEDNKDHSVDNLEPLLQQRKNSPVGALDLELSTKMEEEIEFAKKDNDSVGGTICCVINNVPPGMGGPIFNSIESNISKGIFSIPAIKGIEFGAGFKASRMKGSEHNDPWTIKNGKIRTTKNDSGGIIGGISTGMPIVFTLAVKPTSSIGIVQKTVNVKTMEEEDIKIEGRNDPCIVPRAIVVVESIAAIVILDYLLIEGRVPSVLEN
ncbi:MAG: chorismate synthase [Candidatus Lokiarchaeota archaeon]|nr:chorismate synthase [Candidatus Lokiarchaeota archaeon]